MFCKYYLYLLLIFSPFVTLKALLVSYRFVYRHSLFTGTPLSVSRSFVYQRNS